MGGPNGCRALLAKVDVTLANGTHLYLATTPDSWEVAPGPVVWDHFFHGETYGARFSSLYDPALLLLSHSSLWGSSNHTLNTEPPVVCFAFFSFH